MFRTDVVQLPSFRHDPRPRRRTETARPTSRCHSESRLAAPPRHCSDRIRRGAQWPGGHELASSRTPRSAPFEARSAPTPMCRTGALGGAPLVTFGARVRCTEVERRSAVLGSGGQPTGSLGETTDRRLRTARRTHRLVAVRVAEPGDVERSHVAGSSNVFVSEASNAIVRADRTRQRRCRREGRVLSASPNLEGPCGQWSL
jgi:hypothetical protein